MTDDTLRKECERLYDDVLPAYYEDDVRERSITALLAFARAQQAKGLREAAALCKTKGKMHDMDWWREATKMEVSKVTALDLAEIIEANATAREQAPTGQECTSESKNSQP